MPSPSDSHRDPKVFDARILEQMACPVCYGDLKLAPSADSIVCAGCSRVYPLIDGIPVLIPDRAAIAKQPI